LERAKGIEPSTLSLGSIVVTSKIKGMVAKLRLSSLNRIKQIQGNDKTVPGSRQCYPRVRKL